MKTNQPLPRQLPRGGSTATPAGRHGLRLLAVSADATNAVSQIRLGIPLDAMLRRHGGMLRLKSFHECVLSDWLWADIVVLQRAIGAKFRKRMEWLHRRGITVVYEIDDLLMEPADHLIDAQRLKGQSEGVRAMLGRAHAITCSTPRLAQRLATFGPPVFLMPNYGPPALAWRARHDDARPVTVVVAASDRQRVDALAEGLKRLLAQRQGIRVVAIGPVAQCLVEHGLAVRQLPLLGRDEFLRTIAALPNPVGAIPLDDSPFSSCKSAVKYFDYTMAGLPCICSDVPPYADVVAPGHTGLLCADDPRAWHDALERLCASAALRSRLNDAACAQVEQQHGLQQTVAAWEGLIEHLGATQPVRHGSSPLQASLDVLGTGFSMAAAWLRRFNHHRKSRRRARRSHP